MAALLLLTKTRRAAGLALAAAAVMWLTGCTFNLVKIERVEIPLAGTRPSSTTQPGGMTPEQEAELDRLWSNAHE